MNQEKAYEKFWSKEVWLYCLIILVILGAAFYWVSIRPDNIRKQCYKTAHQSVSVSKESILVKYADCVASHGLPISVPIINNSN